MAFSELRQNWLDKVNGVNISPGYIGFEDALEAADQLSSDYHNAILNGMGDPFGNKVVSASGLPLLKEGLVAAFTGFKPQAAFESLLATAFTTYWPGATLEIINFPPGIIAGISNVASTAAPINISIPFSDGNYPTAEDFIDILIEQLDIQLTTVAGIYTGTPPGVPPPPPLPVPWTAYIAED